MLINTEESLYDWSDMETYPDTAEDYVIEIEKYEDEELLHELEICRRQIGCYTYKIELALEEIKERQLLIPAPEITLVDRSDDWLADRKNEIKEEIAGLKKQISVLDEESESIVQEFIDRFTERGTTGTKTDKFTVSLSEDDAYPEVIDRTDFEKYILETGKIHLLQKRPSVVAMREELNIMDEEKEGILRELEENGWKEEECFVAWLDIKEREENIAEWDNEKIMAFRAKKEEEFALLRKLQSLEEIIKNELNEYFKIPGMGIRTKLTLSQRRGSKKK